MAYRARNLFVLTLGLAMAGTSAASEPQVPLKTLEETRSITELSSKVNSKLDVSESTLQQLSFLVDEAGHVSTTVEIDGESVTLELEPYSMRSPKFQLLTTQGPDGALISREAPPFQTLKGFVLDRPDIEVRASLGDAGLQAIILRPDGHWAIDPVTDLGFQAAPDLHVVYHSQNWLDTHGYTCGVEHDPIVPDAAAAAPGPEGGTRGAAGTGDKIAELGIDADSAFIVDEGGTTGALNRIEAVMNSVAGVYNLMDINYEITTVILRVDAPSDPYTSANGVSDLNQMLDKFRSTWNSSPENNIQRDVAHLFTGRSLSGSVIGVAWLNGVCTSNFQFGLSENLSNFNSQVGLTAHELGHNWSSPHCDGTSSCRIMCSGLGGCSGLSPLSFGPFAVGEITDWRDSVGCLSDLGLPLTLPFCEEFASGLLNGDTWSYIDGASISSSASNMPTLPFALRLNSASSADYADDELRSNFLPLGGEFGAELTLFTQHQGVEAGKQMFVDYWHISDFWSNLLTITSDGIDQTEFEFHSILLPITAAHSDFRLRLRTEGDSSTDNWYVDNVGIDCFCENPCSDSDACTTGDSCDDILCVGAAVDCSGFDQECSAAQCDANGTDGNCDMFVPAFDGEVCGGGIGICADGACQDLTNTARVFMARLGDQGSVASVGPTSMVMAQGTTMRVAAYIRDEGATGDLINGYQLLMSDTATAQAGATGTVTYLDNDPGTPALGDSILLDTTRPDWIFADDGFVLNINYNESPAVGIFGLFYSTLPGTGQDPASQGDIRYLGEFDLAASADALGEFRLNFNTASAPLISFFGPTGAIYTIEQVQPLIVEVVEQGSECVTIADCADLDQNGIRDDGCRFWECQAGTCLGTDIVYADMGGFNGACPADGTADGNDNFHALNCFSDINTQGLAGYPCADAPPAAMNVDAAGLAQPCTPDGVCDGNDSFAALNAFSGSTSCTCSGPAPSFAPVTIDRTSLKIVARESTVRPGGTVVVDVYLAEAAEDLRGYQLHLGTRGGARGRLQVADVAIENRRDAAFAGLGAWQAFNATISQMVSGLNQQGVAVSSGTYLATYTLRVSPDAAGEFIIDVLADTDDASQRTALFPTPAAGLIEISATEPARITVSQRGKRSARLGRR